MRLYRARRIHIVDRNFLKLFPSDCQARKLQQGCRGVAPDATCCNTADEGLEEQLAVRRFIAARCISLSPGRTAFSHAKQSKRLDDDAISAITNAYDNRPES
jgi:hypothetical protein